MDKLRKTLSGRDQEEEEDGFGFSGLYDKTSLSWSTRLKGFLICFILGLLLSFVGTCVLFFNIIGFAVLYSIGTLLSLLSTMFLMGPCNQMKRMFDPNRLIATIVLLVCIALTITFAVVDANLKFLAVIFCLLQFLALCWYSISYIPFARDAVMKTCTTCIS